MGELIEVRCAKQSFAGIVLSCRGLPFVWLLEYSGPYFDAKYGSTRREMENSNMMTHLTVALYSQQM